MTRFHLEIFKKKLTHPIKYDINTKLNSMSQKKICEKKYYKIRQFIA